VTRSWSGGRSSGGTRRPAFSYVAYVGQEPAGFVLSEEYEAYDAVIGGRDLFIGLVGTRRVARGRVSPRRC